MKRAICYLMSIWVLLSSLSVFVGAEKAPQERVAPQSHDALITSENLIAIGDTVEFYFDKKGMDFAVYQPNTGYVWASSVDTNRYKEQTYNTAGLSTFVSLTVSNDTSQDVVTIYDQEKNDSILKVSYRNVKNGIGVKLFLKNMDIELEIVLTLEGDILVVDIPQEAIRENGKHTLVSISLFPTFAAAMGTQDGYLFFPDGSGSLIDLKESNGIAYPKILSFYGEQEATSDCVADYHEQGVEALTCPVFGIKADQTALFGNVTEGSAEASLVLAPSGYIYKNLYRSYITFSVHRSYTYQSSSENIQYIVDKNCIQTERRVEYSFLTGASANYSGMARVYRDYLKQLMNRTALVKTKDIPLFLDFFMGTTKEEFIFRRFVSTTTFAQAEEMLKDLTNKGISEYRVQLLGWNKGGYEASPTVSAPARQLGGKRGLNSLLDYCEEENISLSLQYNSMLANTKTGSYNSKKETIRTYPGTIVDSSDGIYRFLTGNSFLNKYLKVPQKNRTRFPYAGISFGDIGNWLFYSYSKSNASTRQENLNSITAGLDTLRQEADFTVTAGSIYATARAANVIRVPDEHSEYTISDRSVPFYQMVLHGWVRYTTTAGNRYYDFDKQVLRWVETGAMPYFELTWESSESLRETNYNQLFSSEYSHWSDNVVQTYQKLNADFAELQDQTIDSHEYLQDQVVRVVYSNGTKVYVNYTDQIVTVDGVSINAEEYSVVK